MGDGHDHSHHHSGNIKTAFFLNLGFTIVELVGGVLTNSVAILADAIHDLGDSVSLGMAWYFDHLSHKERTVNYSYGFKRFSVIGAIINALILLVGSLFIITETIPRLTNPTEPDTIGMLWIAVLGVVVNGAAVFKLKSGHTINEKVVYLHLMEDVLGWIAVLIGAIVMHFYDIPIIDPILSLAISLYILVNVFKGLKSVFSIIMQGVPDTTDIDQLKHKMLEVKNVKDVHDIHVWTMDGEYNVLTAHVVVGEDTDFHDLSYLKKKLNEKLIHEQIHHTTLEFEQDGVDCDHEKYH